jgi:hypothetical protein
MTAHPEVDGIWIDPHDLPLTDPDDPTIQFSRAIGPKINHNLAKRQSYG